MLVHHFLEQSARLHPEKVALVYGNQRLTYAQIDASANQLAQWLLANNIKRGDRIAIYLENCPEAAIAVFGILKAGAIFTLINATTKAEKLAFVLNNCRASALITNGKRFASLAEILQSIPSLERILLTQFEGQAQSGTISFDKALASQNTYAPHCPSIDLDLAALVYTSGSTGSPKGVMCTHRMMVTAATSVIEYLENTPEDIILNFLPFSFGYGLYQWLMTCQVGATLVLERGFTFPYQILQRLQEEKVTGFAGVPTFFATILQIESLREMQFPHLRFYTNAAAALPVSHIQQLIRTFPTAKFYSMYGLTECKRVSYLPPEEIERRPNSVGIAIPNTEVYIVDENDQRVPPGVAGELVVRGSHLMAGYWEAPEDTARALKPGPLPGERVLYSGDLFRMDEEGFLYFVSRKDDVIKCRGEKVSPHEVETALHTLKGVAEAGVIGTPDLILGEAIVAYIVQTADACLTERDVLGHCRRNLEDHMVPKRVEFLPALPKNGSGKTDKLALREMAKCAAL
jgi:amino acid adenylation domain-containing protein